MEGRMKLLMTKGNSGEEVDQLARALAKALGADAQAFPVLDRPGSPIDDEFDAAIRRWQAGIGVIAEGFVPIAEFPSKFNTPPGGAQFSKYDSRADLGNSQPGDGARYRGRGFVQLTGKANYEKYGERIGFPLLTDFDKANAPEVAAVVLAVFLSDKADKFRDAVGRGRLDLARKLVNGGSHGLDSFKDVFRLAGEVR